MLVRRVMGRGQTSSEFASANGPYWYYAGGVPGDPGIVTDAARKFGDLYGLDAEWLDDEAANDGWEFHDSGYDEKIEQLAKDAVKAMSDVYPNFAALKAAHPTGAFTITLHRTGTDVLVEAPHSGGIELGTAAIGAGIAGVEMPGALWDFYEFKGVMPAGGNAQLHITSVNFDEPICRWAGRRAMRVVAVHGAPGVGMKVHVGGLDILMRDRVIAALNALTGMPSGFAAVIADLDANGKSIAGTEPTSITNDCVSGQGVQAEFEKGIRMAMFDNFAGDEARWASRNDTYFVVVDAIRSALATGSVLIAD